MPTYGYRCDKGHEFEVLQGITEAPLKKCTECGAPVRRIFYPVGIVFKGPGFYKTDSRGGSGSGIPAGEDRSASGDKAEVKKADPKPAKGDSKPAAKADAKPTKKPA
ncbi:MAG: hypothetical protein QOE92_2118 [Chloroflexota bacterium]|jgi:putative FmdB family regulatory protein|nr:hypothetical protein [Chloroflexota bacterium]